MVYLLALVGGVTLIVLFWKAFGPQTAPSRGTRALGAPDDDPDFLRGLGRRDLPEDDDPR